MNIPNCAEANLPFAFRGLVRAASRTAKRRRAMLAAAFAAVLCLDPGLGMSQPLGIPASFTVGAMVLPHTAIVALATPTTLEVQTSDVERGYIEVSSTVRLTVSNTSPEGFALDLSPTTTAFSTITVRAAGGEATLDAGGGTIVQRGQRGPAIPVLLTFRFNLALATAPGRYPWPVHFAARPLTAA